MSIINPIDAYQVYSLLSKSDPQFRSAQRNLFSSLAHLFPPAQMPAALDKEVFYFEAQKILDGLTFQNQPTLISLARKYQAAFNQTISLLGSGSPDLELSELGRAHKSFVNAFIPQWKRVDHDTPGVVSMDYKETLNLLQTAIFPDMASLREQIEEFDGLFLTLTLPNLAIENIISNPDIFEQETFPELFASLKKELFKKSKTYADLSEAEKKNLHLKVLGRQVDLQPATEQLYKSIRMLTTVMHKSQLLRRESGNVTNAFFIECNKAFRWLAALPSDRAIATDLEAAHLLISTYINSSLNKSDLPISLLYNEECRVTLQRMKSEGARPEEITQLSQRIASMADTGPWLQLIKSRCPSGQI